MRLGCLFIISSHSPLRDRPFNSSGLQLPRERSVSSRIPVQLRASLSEPRSALSEALACTMALARGACSLLWKAQQAWGPARPAAGAALRAVSDQPSQEAKDKIHLDPFTEKLNKQAENELAEVEKKRMGQQDGGGEDGEDWVDARSLFALC